MAATRRAGKAPALPARALACWLVCALLCVPAWAQRGAQDGTPLGTSSRTETISDRAQAVVDATRFAYGLEAQYWRNPARFPSAEDVYAHYRQGFSPDLALSMTTHTLTGDPDLATWVPEQVQIAELSNDKAQVWFPTPAAFGEHGAWGLKPFMHLRLRREDGRWVVFRGEDRSVPPVSR